MEGGRKEKNASVNLHTEKQRLSTTLVGFPLQCRCLCAVGKLEYSLLLHDLHTCTTLREHCGRGKILTEI